MSYLEYEDEHEEPQPKDQSLDPARVVDWIIVFAFFIVMYILWVIGSSK